MVTTNFARIQHCWNLINTHALNINSLPSFTVRYDNGQYFYDPLTEEYGPLSKQRNGQNEHYAVCVLILAGFIFKWI